MQSDVDANSTKINDLNDTLKNFVDLSTNQTVAGNKNFQSDIIVNGITIGKGKFDNIQNTAIGVSALSSNTAGLGNTATGQLALSSNTTGNYNTAIGQLALSSNTTGSHNTATGHYALNINTGSSNTANGMNALRNNTTGDNNTSVGKSTLYYSTGDNNTALGYWALHNNTTGSNNTAIGHRSLVNNKSSDYNTAIGYNTNTSANVSNATAIGNGAFVNQSNTIQLGNTAVTNVKTSGTITAGAITLPNTDGKKDQVLTTNGSGTVTWNTISTSDVVLAKMPQALSAIAKVGNLEFRYNKTSTNGFLEVRTASGSMHAQAYCTKKSYSSTKNGISNQKNFRNDVSYTSSSWRPLITLWDGSGYNDRVTLGTYDTIEGTLHEMGNGSNLPSAELYEFRATIDGYNQIVIKVEYTK